MPKIVVIAHDIRSTHNVGALLRTAEGLGVERVYLTGYTPYPELLSDMRLPHLAKKLDKQIKKTSLGSEAYLAWEHAPKILPVIKRLKLAGYMIAALEQSKAAIPLPQFKSPERIALLLGREVEGIDKSIVKNCGIILEIPMFGNKKSFNVVEAASMALYHLRFNT